MARRRRLSVLLLLPLVLLGLAACGGDDDDDDTSSDTTEAETEDTTEDTTDDGGEGTEIDITATDYAFEAPTEIEGGAVTVNFTNDGESTHEASFIRMSDNMVPSVEDFTELFGPVLEGGPIPEDFEAISGVVEVEGGESISSTITLPEGEWALFCAISDEPAEEGDPEGTAEGQEGEAAPPHYTLGMYEAVEVSGGEDAELPEADGTITAQDYEFTFDVEAGDETINFVNEGPDQIHHAVLMAFEEGVDEAAAEEAVTAFLSAEEGTPPPEGTPEPEEIGGSFVFSPGMGGTFEVDGGFESGRVYVAMCFIQDREGGPPHAIAHQMITTHLVE